MRNPLNLRPIEFEPVTEAVRQPHFRREHLSPFVPPATPDDQLAREAVASVEREEGFFGCAEHRLNGAYDGDSEHRIALEAIKLVRAQLRKEREGN